MSADRTAEILNYLSAISREVGELRMEMRQRFERIENEMRQRFEGVTSEMRQGFKGAEDEIKGLRRETREVKRRLDRIEATVLVTNADVGDLDDRVSALESKSA